MSAGDSGGSPAASATVLPAGAGTSDPATSSEPASSATPPVAEPLPESLRNPDPKTRQREALRLLKLVRGRPDADRTRRALVAWARAEGRTTGKGSSHCNFAPGTAWQVLIELRVLRVGMTVSELEAVIGPPSSLSPDEAVWYADSPCHVNPRLIATLVAGRVRSFDQSDV
jgi:hypothetical protein